METIYILDSTVFLEGYSSGFLDKACVTTYFVLEEMRSPQAKIEFDVAVKSGMGLIRPSELYFEKVRKALEKTNDKLSKADISVLALTFEFTGKGKAAALVSDDYGVQNTAKILGIKTISVSKKGIKSVFEWKNRKCRACGSKTEEETCEICGSETGVVPEKLTSFKAK